ncbi:MAG: hypothetical protein HYU64_02425 [Armatimonadetes bacterium]|nr:hypothetical protein [Armatimonadota bacterium]
MESLIPLDEEERKQKLLEAGLPTTAWDVYVEKQEAAQAAPEKKKKFTFLGLGGKE